MELPIDRIVVDIFEMIREKNVRRHLGYHLVYRRLQCLSRIEDPPFRGAGLGTSDNPSFKGVHEASALIAGASPA